MKLAWRIGDGQWETDAQFERLLELLRSYRGAVDEVSLFVGETATSHAYTPLEKLAGHLERAGLRMRQLKADGFDVVGFNMWPTPGSEYGGDASCLPALPFQPMVGYDGTVAASTACMKTAEFRTYIRKKYALLAAQHPDFIWVDDDVRMAHLGVPYPCFCPTCLAAFGDGQWTRESLTDAFNAPDGAGLRRAWIEFNATTLVEVCGEIANAIREVDPRIDVGLMTVGPTHTTYSGDFYTRCLEALGGRRGRPGHGYYTDQRRLDLISKAFEVGRQARAYPKTVDNIQYELENYPDITLDKAVQTVVNECTVALACGCNGVAYNALPNTPGPLEEFAPLLRRMAAERPGWEVLAEAAAGLAPVGLWLADTPLLMANRAVDDRGWFHEDPGWHEGGDYHDAGFEYNISAPNGWAELGFPLTTNPDAACGTLLAGRIAECFDDDRLRRMLSGAVFMDARALQVLCDRGLGNLAGVEPDQRLPGARERLTDHPLNGPYADSQRSALAGGWSLRAIAGEVAELSTLVRSDGVDCGPCVSAYTNELGGRVVVMAYAAWARLGTAAKWHQLRTFIEWATDGRLPLVLERPSRVTPFVRMNPEGTRFVAVLLNNGLDPTGSFEVKVRAHVGGVCQAASSGRILPLPVKEAPDGVVVTLENIPAWTTATLVGK